MLGTLIGKPAEQLMSAETLFDWDWQREPDAELERTYYSAQGRALEFICDAQGTINTIFVRPCDPAVLAPWQLPIEFATGRAKLCALLGPPERCREAFDDPIMGRMGAWDRFVMDGYLLHVGYNADCSAISMQTLMDVETAP